MNCFHFQNKELIGDNGLLPLKHYLRRLADDGASSDEGSLSAKFQQHPTLFWLLDPWHSVDWALDLAAIVGMGIAFAIFVTGIKFTKLHFCSIFSIFNLR
jgi:hypothetical protein